MTSRAQRWGGVQFDDQSFNHSQYTPQSGYAQSKTADVLFAVELDDRAKEYGVRAFAAHPGPTPGTNLGSGSLPEDASGVKKGVARALSAAMRFWHIPQLSNLVQRRKKDHHVGDEIKTVPQGAATPQWCAVSPQLAGMGGVYCEDCNIAYAVDDPESPFGVLPWAIDPELAKKLWIMSEAMTGVTFDL